MTPHFEDLQDHQYLLAKQKNKTKTMIFFTA